MTATLSILRKTARLLEVAEAADRVRAGWPCNPEDFQSLCDALDAWHEVEDEH